MVGSWPRALVLGQVDPGQHSTMTTTNTPSYFRYVMNKVFMEYIDKIVVIIIWWHTFLLEDRRRAIQLVKEHLKTAMLTRKNYTNDHRQEVNFPIEDRAYLQTTPIKETEHFHVKRKLTPILPPPFKITTRREINGYQLEIPPESPTMHNVFHASQLWKCFRLPS